MVISFLYFVVIFFGFRNTFSGRFIYTAFYKYNFYARSPTLSITSPIILIFNNN
jgi:hypothetical protein